MGVEVRFRPTRLLQRSLVVNGTSRQFAAMHNSGRFWSEADIADFMSTRPTTM
jgi:hypothetical protein